MRHYGIGRGEAACLALAKRHGATAIFVSSDRLACRAAQDLGVTYTTLEDILRQWVTHERPTHQRIHQLVNGMRLARFGLKEDFLRLLIAGADN
jgi:predicted nucleic acid-binding protein